MVDSHQNPGKLVYIVLLAGNLSEAVYGKRVTGEGPTYRKRLKGQVSCGACRELLAAGSLTIYLITQHGRVAETRRQWSTLAAGDGHRTFRMTFPANGGPQNCPVEGCPGWVATRTAMQMHFLHRHVLNTVVVLEKGNLPHPWCARCDIMFPRRALNVRHLATAQCARGAERKRWRLAEADTRESSERSFEAYGELIQNFSSFRYLGRVLTAGYDDWLTMLGNLGKARKSWGRLFCILIPEGADPKVSVNFNKTCSSPRRAVCSHSLVCSKSSLLILGIGSVINKYLKLIFWSDRSDRTCVYS